MVSGNGSIFLKQGWFDILLQTRVDGSFLFLLHLSGFKERNHGNILKEEEEESVLPEHTSQQ